MVGWGCGREDQARIGQGVEQGFFFFSFSSLASEHMQSFGSMTLVDLLVFVDG